MASVHVRYDGHCEDAFDSERGFQSWWGEQLAAISLLMSFPFHEEGNVAVFQVHDTKVVAFCTLLESGGVFLCEIK